MCVFTTRFFQPSFCNAKKVPIICFTMYSLHLIGLHPHIKRTAMDEVVYFHTLYHKGTRWYLNHMPCSYADDVIIEKSPEYFHHKMVRFL